MIDNHASTRMLPSVPLPKVGPAASGHSLNYLSNEIDKLQTRLNAKNIITQAKRFKEYQNKGLIDPRKLGPNQLRIVDLNKKVSTLNSQGSDIKPRNLAAFNTVSNVTDFKDLPLDVFLTRSKEHSVPDISGLHVSSLSGAYPGTDHKYKMVATKGHYERTEMVKLPDPFKKHYITFETHKKLKLKTNLRENQHATAKMRQNSEQYPSYTNTCAP